MLERGRDAGRCEAVGKRARSRRDLSCGVAKGALLRGKEPLRRSVHIRHGCEVDVDPNLAKVLPGQAALLPSQRRGCHLRGRVVGGAGQALDLPAFLVGHDQQAGLVPLDRSTLDSSISVIVP